ncbi:hypothetical protein SERLA73DRAFT_63042, partial [Serpula lacrymans var. lacrymans S7.3]
FEILHVLSSSRESTLHLCRERDGLKLYAIKIINKNRISVSGRSKNICYEQNILKKIEELEHPFLPPLYWNFQDEVSVYFVTDFYSGGNLYEKLTQDGPFDCDRAHFYACELVAGMAALHGAGIIHRDLKPENIMIDIYGHIVITGFSCAMMPTPCGAPCSGDIPEFGARGYQAPELFLGWMHDFSVDCWSFGAILYTMLYASVGGVFLFVYWTFLPSL